MVLNKKQLDQAVLWLHDCFQVSEMDTWALTPAEIERCLDNGYPGGRWAFWKEADTYYPLPQAA